MGHTSLNLIGSKSYLENKIWKKHKTEPYYLVLWVLYTFYYYKILFQLNGEKKVRECNTYLGHSTVHVDGEESTGAHCPLLKMVSPDAFNRHFIHRQRRKFLKTEKYVFKNYLQYLWTVATVDIFCSPPGDWTGEGGGGGVVSWKIFYI